MSNPRGDGPCGERERHPCPCEDCESVRAACRRAMTDVAKLGGLLDRVRDALRAGQSVSGVIESIDSSRKNMRND